MIKAQNKSKKYIDIEIKFRTYFGEGIFIIL